MFKSVSLPGWKIRSDDVLILEGNHYTGLVWRSTDSDCEQFPYVWLVSKKDYLQVTNGGKSSSQYLACQAVTIAMIACIVKE